MSEKNEAARKTAEELVASRGLKWYGFGTWNHPRGHVWNVVVRPASS